MLSVRQIFALALTVLLALHLEGCDSDSKKPEVPCWNDQTIKMYYELITKDPGVVTGRDGSNISYRVSSAYDMVSVDDGPIKIPVDSAGWIQSIRKKAEDSGFNAERPDGSTVLVQGQVADNIADEIESTILCRNPHSDCPLDTATFTSASPLWFLLVQIKSECGNYLFNMSDVIKSESVYKPPCCLPGCFDNGTACSQGPWMCTDAAPVEVA
eukprot:TRINITY_DN107433_c0_g1_i1.p1 TRINITY_DN107433_c0_g1~~TRINITY_DN107433_c0_g1_i1.p1  ORF type:complete len:213 (+),score=22.37 TRINITY_DN107433_c0_g1_i1:84-722(+)